MIIDYAYHAKICPRQIRNLNEMVGRGRFYCNNSKQVTKRKMSGFKFEVYEVCYWRICILNSPAPYNFYCFRARNMVIGKV